MDAQYSQVAPWLQNAGAAAGIAGTGLSAYGSLLASRQAADQYRMAVEAWRQDQERQKRMDAENARQAGVNNSLNAGQYATNQSNDIEDPYIQYARALGL